MEGYTTESSNAAQDKQSETTFIRSSKTTWNRTLLILMRNLLPLALLASAFLFAQSVSAQVRLGAVAGLDASNVKFETSRSGTDPLLGYHGGLIADIGLSTKFSIRPSLLYTVKGLGADIEVRNDQGQLTGTLPFTFRINYIELPVLLLYRANVGKNCKIFGGAGPYAAAGVSGKSYVRFNNVSGEPAKFGPRNNREEGAFNRMDYGLAATVGLEIKRVWLSVNYSHGLTNISPSYRVLQPESFYNRSLSLSVGYWLCQ